jgi:hypothetical protein
VLADLIALMSSLMRYWGSVKRLWILRHNIIVQPHARVVEQAGRQHGKTRNQLLVFFMITHPLCLRLIARLHVSLQRVFLCILWTHSSPHSIHFYLPLQKKRTIPIARVPPVSKCRGDKIMKTPVGWINSALVETFGSRHVLLEKCYSPSQLYVASGVHKDQSDFEIVVMDCILSRTIKIQKLKRKRQRNLLTRR